MKIAIEDYIQDLGCVESLKKVSAVDLEALASAMGRYEALLREWNPFASLMSERDIAEGIRRHIADGLSLIPVVAGLASLDRGLTDIGSGGGFPAIPIKAALPELRMTLVERSQKKAAFLLKVVGALGFKGVRVLCESFPRISGGLDAGVFTARAVERPGQVVPEVLGMMGPGAVFLNQTPYRVEGNEGMFHVEPIHDVWTDAGLRRGTLELARRIY